MKCERRENKIERTTWWTAKLELIPAPFISLPWTYSLLTDGPIPFGHTAITLKCLGKSSPSDCKCPRRKPWDSPSMLFGFMLENIFS